MPSMTFRFTTECELTLDGQSYEDIYLKFKDICQSDAPFLQQHQLTLFPPEQSTVLFEVDEQNQFNAMELKGNFQQDIIENLPENWVRRIRSHPIKAVKT